MMVRSKISEKPGCRLPDIPTASHLIGKTVTALREAGRNKEMRDFINEIRKKDLSLDYYSVFTIASSYVHFSE